MNRVCLVFSLLCFALAGRVQYVRGFGGTVSMRGEVIAISLVGLIVMAAGFVAGKDDSPPAWKKSVSIAVAALATIVAVYKIVN